MPIMILTRATQGGASMPRMDSITGGSPVEVTWIDPRTGQRLPAGRLGNVGVRMFSTTEGWGNPLLILEVAVK